MAFDARATLEADKLPRVARKPKTLLEVNVLLAAGSLMTEAERMAGKKLPLIRQARLMVKAMPKATRMAEFIAMWSIAKYQQGEVSAESVADYWDEPVRTVYRRLEEFRGAWSPAGHDTPDKLADHLIADYRKRKERMEASDIARLLSANVPAPPTSVSGATGG